MPLFRLFLAFWLLGSPAAVGAVSLERQRISPQVLANPEGLALSADQTLLYVADRDNGRIAVLNAATLQLVSEIGGSILERPRNLAVTRDGSHLYVADAGQERVVVFRLTGSEGQKETWLDTTGKPTSVAVHTSGLVFIAKRRLGTVSVYDRNLEPSHRIDDIISAHDIEVDRNGLWVADPVANELIRFTIPGKRLQTIKGTNYGLSAATYFAVGENGLIWVTDQPSGSLHALNLEAASELKLKWESSLDHKPPTKLTGLATAGENLWVADALRGRILRYQISQQ